MNKKLLAAPIAMAAVLGLALTGCSSDSGAPAGDGGPQIDVPEIPAIEKLGENEKELNIVAWSGFVEPAWADQFTADTGCVVNRKVAATSDEMVQLMRTGEYDLVSASGDASLRLIVDGNVQPLTTDLIPNFSDDIVEGMKGQLYDTLNGNVYGIPIGRGANVLQYNSEAVTEAPDSWDVVWEKDSPYAGKIAAYDSPIYIADAAIYLMEHEPDLGITNPLRARPGAAAGRHRAAQAAERDGVRVLVARDQRDFLHRRQLGGRHLVGGAAQGDAGREVQERPPQGGRDRLV